MRSQLIRSFFLFATTNALAAAMPLLLLPILTRVLTPEEYGLVAMYSIVLTVFGALAGLSVHGAVGMRYFDRHELKFPVYVGNCLIILLASTAILLGLVTLLGEQLEKLTKLPIPWLFAAVGVAGMQFILLVRLSIFQSAKRAGYFSLYRSGQALIDMALSLLLVLCLAMAWEGRLIGMSGAIVLAGLVSFWSMLDRGWISWRVDKEYLKSALRFGVPLIPHVVGSMLLATVDRVLIANLIGIGDAGVYLVAVQIGLGVFLVADGCNRAISPWMIEALKNSDADMDARIVRYVLLYFTGLVAFAFMVGGVAPWLLPVIVGPAFADAAGLVLPIALGQAFGGMYLVVSNLIFYHGKTVSLSVVTLSCGLLNAGLSYLMLKLMGVSGAALAYLVAQIALFSAIFVVSQRLRPLPWMAAFRAR